MSEPNNLKEFSEKNGLIFSETSINETAEDSYVYSPDMQYRYAFTRRWRPDGYYVLWVGINPATGDTENRRRPTLERCIKWSVAWGASGLIYANLFAFRHTDPKVLVGAKDPVGAYNDEALELVSRIANRTVVAWGNSAKPEKRVTEVMERKLLKNTYCLGFTSKGHPRHPLYVRNDAVLEPWAI